ncbi:hypothetical protein BH09BAC5_BH09BAC5_29070 [soil metagenome]
MEPIRKNYQGVWNIVRFNWHFYLLATAGITLLFLASIFLPEKFILFDYLLVISATVTILISLLVSWYIYDYSDLYKYGWLKQRKTLKADKIGSFRAGFDETSREVQ